MDDEIKEVFAAWMYMRTEKFPHQVQNEDKERFKQLLALFIHESENMLRDYYGCDD